MSVACERNRAATVCTCRKGARCLPCIDADGLTRGNSLPAILHRLVRRVLAGAA